MDTVKLVIVGQENVGKSFLTSCVKQSILSGKKKCKHTIPLPTTKGIDRDQVELKVNCVASPLPTVVEFWLIGSIEHIGFCWQ